MKLLYSLFLLIFSSVAIASQVVIYYPSHGHLKHAQEVKKIFADSYKLPVSLIHLRHQTNCHSADQRFLELCIKENYELEKIENKNQEEIKKSLLIFSKTTEVTYDY